MHAEINLLGKPRLHCGAGVAQELVAHTTEQVGRSVLLDAVVALHSIKHSKWMGILEVVNPKSMTEKQC